MKKRNGHSVRNERRMYILKNTESSSRRLIRVSTHTANLDGCLEFEETGLAQKDFTTLDDHATNLRLCEVDHFPWSGSSHLQQLVDDRVDVDFHFVLETDGDKHTTCTQAEKKMMSMHCSLSCVFLARWRISVVNGANKY